MGQLPCCLFNKLPCNSHTLFGNHYSVTEEGPGCCGHREGSLWLYHSFGKASRWKLHLNRIQSMWWRRGSAAQRLHAKLWWLSLDCIVSHTLAFCFETARSETVARAFLFCTAFILPAYCIIFPNTVLLPHCLISHIHTCYLFKV